MDADEDNGVAPAPLPSLNRCSAITDGAVSGVIPKSGAFAVNYPGYPSSPSRAIQTLGGLKEIAIKRSTGSGSGQLELRFRPEDPYCHPASGQLRAFSGLLLKITKSRPESDSNEKVQLSAGIVARIDQAYNFEGMVDYQHVLPVHAANARGKKRSYVSDGETNLEKEADIMMLAPQLFSPKDNPGEIVLNRPANLFSKNMQRNVVEHRWEMDIEPCLAIAFNIEKIPDKVNWEDNISRDTDEWELQSHVSRLFEERPIWPRWSIYENLLDNGLDVTKHILKRLLFRVGYYFSTGPFGRFCIRRGYDPRKDPESRIYQRIDFRVPIQLRNVEANLDAESMQTWKDVCQFEVFPWKHFSNLQFFELKDDFIQEEIRKPTDQTICTRARGWFSEARIKMLRLRVSIRFFSICPKESAQILLRSACEEFERLKKMESLRRFRRPLSESLQLACDSKISTEDDCAEPNGEKAQASGQDGLNNCEIENDEEGEEEEEEEEEEMEGEEEEKSPAVAVEEGGFVPETCSLGDSIANDFLQDILHGFPFNKDGIDSRPNEDLQDAEASDGEYQIYEQDSDDDDDQDFM